MNDYSHENEATLINDLGYLMKRTSSVVTAKLCSLLKDLNLRVAEATILREIEARPLTTSSEIGRVLNIKRANMTPIVTLLVERGFIEILAKDGRSQGLRLTESGQELMKKVHQVFKDHDTMIFSSLSDNDREQLEVLLKRIMSKNSD
jgi:DNA-binding MarR family transcriptional regulator